MAIIQISKIQQRSGNLVDLPQLDEAQFGWATDAKRLFIGKTTPNENIEVLTSYSNISFSQIDGSGNSNVYITSPIQPGQLLGYNSTLNSWVNTGGNANAPGNSSAYTGIPIHLGSVGNVKIGDGAIGYVLTTDGYGNLSWTSKTTSVANILDISNANPAVMTFDPNVVSYTNGTAVTILGIAGNSSANANLLNGNTFYLKVASNFDSTGEVGLYISDSLDAPNAYNGAGIVYDNPANTYATATSTFGINVSSPAAGVEGSIQYNVSGVLTGSSLLKFANSNVEISTSNVVVTGGNVSANIITGNTLAGSLTTAAQPNITSTGTLAGLVVAGNITPSANITYNLGNNTNRFNDLYLANSTIYIGAQTISANATNVIISGIITGNLAGNATTAGTVVTAAQPNITSVGTLTSVSISGNANIGNIGTAGLITATGNITGGNLITGGTISATGNVTAPNFLGNVVGNISGNLTVNGSNTQVLFNDSGLANANSGFTFDKVTGALSVTGNITAGNVNATFYGAGTGLTSIPGANVTGTVANATHASTANTVTNAAQGNITSVGTLTGLSVNGTVTAVNITANTGIFTGNGSGLSSIAGANVTGTVANATHASTANTVTDSAQSNITSVGTLTSLSVSGNANIGNIGTGGLITATGNVTGGNLITGGLITATGTITGGNLATAGTLSAGGNAAVLGIKTDNYYYANGDSISFAGAYSNSNVSSFLAAFGSNTITTTGNVVVGNISTSGLITVTGNANVGNLGTAGLITATGNIGGGNINTGGLITATGNIGGGNINTSGAMSATGNVTANNVITTKFLINSVNPSVLAAGSTQGTGTVLGNTINVITTVASGAGVVLPTAVAGMTIYITNTSANSLLVYPASGAAINELSTNVALTHATKATIHYVAASSTQWYSVGATYA